MWTKFGTTKLLLSLLVLVLFNHSPGSAKQLTPWPLPGWRQAVTNLGTLDSALSNNLSGSHWNMKQQRLALVVNNPGRLIILGYRGNQFSRVVSFKIKGDLEGVTQVPDLPDDYFILDEKKTRIIQVRVTGKKAEKIQKWNLGKYLPDSGRLGAEGIAFIPDIAIENTIQFKSIPGNSLFKGIFAVAHQNGGNIYFFSLGDETHFLGSITSRRSESSGLEFDQQDNSLYIWHNIKGNSLEIIRLTSLNSTTPLPLIAHYKGPKKGNLESVAVGEVGGSRAIFFTDDDCQDDVSIIFYPAWLPPFTKNQPQ